MKVEIIYRGTHIALAFQSVNEMRCIIVDCMGEHSQIGSILAYLFDCSLIPKWDDVIVFTHRRHLSRLNVLIDGIKMR